MRGRDSEDGPLRGKAGRPECHRCFPNGVTQIPSPESSTPCPAEVVCPAPEGLGVPTPRTSPDGLLQARPGSDKSHAQKPPAHPPPRPPGLSRRHQHQEWHRSTCRPYSPCRRKASGSDSQDPLTRAGEQGSPPHALMGPSGFASAPVVVSSMGTGSLPCLTRFGCSASNRWGFPASCSEAGLGQTAGSLFSSSTAPSFLWGCWLVGRLPPTPRPISVTRPTRFSWALLAVRGPDPGQVSGGLRGSSSPGRAGVVSEHRSHGGLLPVALHMTVPARATLVLMHHCHTEPLVPYRTCDLRLPLPPRGQLPDRDGAHTSALHPSHQQGHPSSRRRGGQLGPLCPTCRPQGAPGKLTRASPARGSPAQPATSFGGPSPAVVL